MLMREAKVSRKISHCHKAIAKVSKALAAAHYEELMSCSNVVYQVWRNNHPGLNAKQLGQAFVNKFWSRFIDAARATLTAQLLQPIDESVKDEIMQILVLDSTLIRGRKNPAVLAGELKQQG